MWQFLDPADLNGAIRRLHQKALTGRKIADKLVGSTRSFKLRCLIHIFMDAFWNQVC